MPALVHIQLEDYSLSLYVKRYLMVFVSGKASTKCCRKATVTAQRIYNAI